MPDKVYVDFSMIVLKERGPKQKMAVLLELIQEYVRKKAELESRGGGPGAPEATAPETSEVGHNG
jgi:hypothetical protein